MKINPNICLVDEDSTLKDSWKLALDAEVELSFFSDPVKLLEQCAAAPKGFLSQYACIVLGRKFQGGRIDICKDDWCHQIRQKGAKLLLLNWDGPITKGDLEGRFDGKIFHRRGVTWAHLRSRIMKMQSNPNHGFLGASSRSQSRHKPSLAESSSTMTVAKSSAIESQVSMGRLEDLKLERSHKCKKILLAMAESAHGQHRDLLLNYATLNHDKGRQLLEAIYNRLLLASTKGFSEDCPSRYINSSPVVAKNLLREALIGESVTTPLQ
ncbi:MAG: hypothetical protein OXT67_13935 [Zetaproteobacteria bacterium]|nr:hypothetical protein [Zetaproteobacteria bacterium]